MNLKKKLTKKIGSGSKDISKKEEKAKRSNGGMFGGFTMMSNALDATTSTSTQKPLLFYRYQAEVQTILTFIYFDSILHQTQCLKKGEVAKPLQKYKVRPIRLEII